MSDRLSIRAAISALLDAARTPTAIAKELGCSRKLVYTVKKLKKNGKGLERAVQQRKSPVLTPRVQAGVKKRIRAAPTKSLRRVAREAGLHPEIVRKVVKNSGWKSLRRVKVPLISQEGRQKRVDRAQGLLNSLKSSPPRQIVFFSDEKTFVLDSAYNPQNDRWVRTLSLIHI